MWSSRLVIFVVDAYIADMSYRKKDTLSPVRWIGQYFLVPPHTGVEYQLEYSICFSADGCTLQVRAVLQDKMSDIHTAHRKPSVS